MRVSLLSTHVRKALHADRPIFGAFADCMPLLALAAVLRFLWLGHASLWIDELFSVCWSRLDLHFLLGEGARTETNPPGYYVLLHVWMALFGTTEFAVRALSALVSAATVPVVYATGRLIANRPTALLAGLLIAVNPVAIGSAQEARAYALSVLLDAIGLLSIVGYMRFKPEGRASWAWLAAFILSTTATAWIHYTSLFFVAACFAAIGWRLLTTRPFPARQALAWIVVSMLTTVPLIKVVILAASLSGSNNLIWIGPLTPSSVVSFFLDLITQLPQAGTSLVVSYVACALLLLVIVDGLLHRRDDKKLSGLLVSISALYCAFFITASWLRPMLLARVATWLEIPFCLLLAQAAQGQPSRWRRNVASAVPLLIFGFSLGYYYQYNQKEDWRGAARLVAANPDCTGPVLISEFNALGLYYYGVWPRRPAYVFLPDPRRRNSVEFNLSERLMHLPELEPGAVVGFIKTHPGSVVIMRLESTRIIPPDLQDLLAHASFDAQLQGGLTVACF